MINKEMTDFISKRLNIANRDLIEKEIIITKMLFYLMQNKSFSQNYAFKGGTCLTKCYLGHYRFSEDMDFTYLNQKDFVGKSKNKLRETMSEKIDKLGKLIEAISKKLDLDFKIEKDNKRYFQFGGSNAFVTFKIWYNSLELGKETFVKIQVNHIEKLNYPIKELNANFIVPKNLEKDFSFIAGEDADILLKPLKIKVYDLREVLIEKVRAILTRRGIKARDFVDVFLIIKGNKLNLNDFKKEIIEKISNMLKFEKYTLNIKNKETQLNEEFILGEEEALMLIPIDKGFPKFLKEFDVFLREIIKELKI
ncbi:nucleotidyl transferase AbiEii/AbiGii toxin family protein [Candidatus Pacearchaeota archaeon]|nr:nucleotidyl transferase AbiEii/AbiGii toxin family protein [Candidatus Pacearchaeota archaeon]